MSKIISLSKLNRFWTKGVKPIKDKVDNPITAYDDLMANTVSGHIVDPLAVKEGFNTVNNSLNVMYHSQYYTENHQATWIKPGIYLVILNYNITGSGAMTITLYDFTDDTSIGYADGLQNPSSERGNIVRLVEITDASHQVGCRVTGTITSVGYTLQALKLK